MNMHSPLRDRPSLTDIAERWLRRDFIIIALSLLLWLAFVARIAWRLPSTLDMTGDSAAYLQQESFRPPFYGWFLNGWRDLTGSLHHLPMVQFLIMAAALLFFAIEFGRMVRNALAGALLIPLVLMHAGIYDAPRWMMTETIYLAEILAGLGLQFRYVRQRRAIDLVAAALCFGLASLTRSTGYAFLALPLLTAALDCRPILLRVALRHATQAGATLLLVLLIGMSWNLARHGRFEIGSWAGLSLLQKSLLLIQPADVAGQPRPVAIVAPIAASERELIARQPDLGAKLRADLQVTSSDLRWGIFIPEAERTWPAWRAADWRERGELGGAVSRRLIARHPGGYLKQWLYDWLGLVLQPAYWPGWATTEEHDRAGYSACRMQGSCWALDRYTLPVRNMVVLIGVSVGGCLASLFVFFRFAGCVLRRQAPADIVLFWSLAIVLQAGLLLSSAFEAGHIRMTVAFHVLELPMLTWLAIRALRAIPRRRRVLHQV